MYLLHLGNLGEGYRRATPSQHRRMASQMRHRQWPLAPAQQAFQSEISGQSQGDPRATGDQCQALAGFAENTQMGIVQRVHYRVTASLLAQGLEAFP